MPKRWGLVACLDGLSSFVKGRRTTRYATVHNMRIHHERRNQTVRKGAKHHFTQPKANGHDSGTAEKQPPKPPYRFAGDLPAPLEPLRASRQWLVWDYVWNDRKEKWDKPPRSAHTGRLASINNPDNLGTFPEAVATAARQELAGVGFLLTPGDDWTGIDLDDCITDSGSYSPLAAEIIDYAETYAEVSPSGKGVRLFALGKVDKPLKHDASGIEVYGTGRYLTITGRQIERTPSEIRPAPRTLARLKAIVEAAQEARRAKPNSKANGKAQTGSGFWGNVNAAALTNLDRWVPELHPTAEKQATGAWRITSEDLGRNLEEDLSYHPDGVRDFGEEGGFSPIDAVQKYGDASDATVAAMWLCQKLGIEPASLGWRGGAKAPSQERHAKPSATERQGSFLLVREHNGERSAGVYYNDTEEAKDADDPKGEPNWRWFCSPLEPLARTRGKDNRNWGRLVEVVDRDGVRHVWAMPARIGPTVGDGADFRRELVDRGLEIASGGKARHRLSDYVTMWKPSRTVRCVSTVGWCGDAFILPDRTFGGTEEVVLQTEGVAPEFAVAGSLDKWRREIAALCVGNSRLTFGVSTAFAGPLLYLANEESGGAHFWGPSSIGKTTILHGARSVWGTPLGSWRATDNSAEATAAGACDTLKTLDEISQAPKAAVGEIAYMLGNGRGKSRMNRNITLRPSLLWRVLFLSTGEVGLATRLQEAGDKARAGQEVRVLEIPADAGKSMGIFENIHDFTSAAELAEHLRLAADRNCGHAAREYVACLATKVKEATRAIHEMRAKFIADHCPTGADGQVRRACGRFAVIAIAGELATMFGITGWDIGEAEEAAARCWQDWLRERGGAGAAEVRNAFRQVRLFLEQHGESRFSVWGNLKERPVANRAGFRKCFDSGTQYYVLPEVFRAEVCKGLDAAMVARAMEERGWLHTQRPHMTRKENIPGEGKRRRVYVIPPEFLSADMDNSAGTDGDAGDEL